MNVFHVFLCGWKHKRAAMVDFEIFWRWPSSKMTAGTSVFHHDDVMFPSNDIAARHSQEPHFLAELEKSVPSLLLLILNNGGYVSHSAPSKKLEKKEALG